MGKEKTNLSNPVQILNSIRANSSKEYQARIPEATKANMAQIMQKLDEYPTSKNDFLNALVNKIGKTVFFGRVLKNNLAMFMRDKLENGKSIEAVYSDIIQAKDFSSTTGNEASDLLGVETPPINVEYYHETFKHKYKTCFSDDRLRGAFTSNNGVLSLINEIVKIPYNSCENDLYLLTKQALEQGKYKEVQCPMPIDNATAKTVVKKLQTYIGKLKFIKNEYNFRGVHTQTSPSDLVIITTPEVKAELNVELLATAFNIDKADVPSRIVEVDEFSDPNRVALLVDKDYIQIYPTLQSSGQFYNPSNLVTSIFYHLQGTVCQCNMLNAIDFRTTLTTQPQTLKVEENTEVEGAEEKTKPKESKETKKSE